MDGTPRDGSIVWRALSQRGFPAARSATRSCRWRSSNPNGDPRRDRLGTRHRRPSSRRPRGTRCVRIGPRWGRSSSPTISDSSTNCSPTRSTSSSTARSSSPAAWNSPRNSSATVRPVRCLSDEHSGRHQAGLPRPSAAGARQAADLSRLGQHLAEAPSRHRRDERVLRDHGTNVHRGSYDLAVRTEALEGAEPRSPASSHAGHQRGRLHQERHRGVQPARPFVGCGQPRSWRRRRDLRDGAPRQHRPWHMLSAEKGFELRWIPVTPTATSISAISTPCSKAPSWCRSRRCPTCSARSTTSLGSPRPHTAPVRCRRRRQPVCAPRSHRRAGDGRRLPHLHRPQDARPDGHRCPVGPRRPP